MIKQHRTHRRLDLGAMLDFIKGYSAKKRPLAELERAVRRHGGSVNIDHQAWAFSP